MGIIGTGSGGKGMTTKEQKNNFLGRVMAIFYIMYYIHHVII